MNLRCHVVPRVLLEDCTACYLPMLNMVKALQANKHPRGTSVVTIKIYILHNYLMLNVTQLKYLLKQLLAMGISCDLLTGLSHSKAKDITSSFIQDPTR